MSLTAGFDGGPVGKGVGDMLFDLCDSGVKDSGIGNEGSKYGLDDYLDGKLLPSLATGDNASLPAISSRERLLHRCSRCLPYLDHVMID
jgi:hypothetical protein